MKAINMIVMFLTFMNCITINPAYVPSTFEIDIRNETFGDYIELKPGTLKRIIISLRNGYNGEVWDFKDQDKYNLTFALKNESYIKLYPSEISIIPSKAIVYTAYIGLDCNHDIKEVDYPLNFEVIDKRDLDGNELPGAEMIISTTIIKINNNPTLIDIEPIEKTVYIRGNFAFIIKNEIFNIEKISIKPIETNVPEFTIQGIEIKPFTDRKIFGKEENENNGLLIDNKLYYNYKSYGNEKNITFNLAIDYGNDNNGKKCFELSPNSQSVNLMLTEQKMVALNDSVKEAILYSMKDVTPKTNKTNNIQIKIDLPVAPIIIRCELRGEGKGEERDSIVYNNYFANTGPYILKFNNLNSNNEYKGECFFSSSNFQTNIFRIAIGNEKVRDFITPLFPSKSIYGTPQCFEFTLKSQDSSKTEEQTKRFSELALKFCNARMISNENVISSIKKNFICTKPDIRIDKNKAIICTGASPSYNPEEIEDASIDEINNYFTKQVEYYINQLNTTKNIELFFYYYNELKGIELVDYKRYYDIDPPDLNKIKLEAIKDEAMVEKDKLKFKIISYNEQPIECFYNYEMKEDDTKRFIDLYKNKEVEYIKSMILNPKEEKLFETNIKDPRDKTMYALYMNCYNLPGARIRYLQTGTFNAYTYLYTDNSEDQSIFVEEKVNVTINCAEIENKRNPICLKGSYNNLKKMVKTKMPEIDEEEELEKFRKLSIGAKIDFLDAKFKNFEDDIANFNDYSRILQNLIKKEQFLTNRDCSIYIRGNSTDSLSESNNGEYKKCREFKKNKQKKIINFLKNKFNCKFISLLISKEGMSNNVEENIKYFILLMQEITNNADSFTKGDIEVLLNMTTCFQENYENYWNQLNEYLERKGTLNLTVSEIKEDISNLLINIMTNLVKIANFEEMDNYMTENEKNITNYGLVGNKKRKQIHKSMKKFVKTLNELGDGLYNLSDSMIINITKNKNYKEKSSNEEKIKDLEAIKFEDKGIILLLHPQYMMNLYDAYTMQVINYESPLVNLKKDNDVKDTILNTFIGITLYDKKRNEIKIDEIPEDVRPQILFNKEYYNYMNICYFYNEEVEDLSEKGVLIDDDYEYDGNKYFKCTAEHLTCFTAGNYYYRISKDPSTSTNKTDTNGNQTNNNGLITFIVLGCMFVIILIFTIIILIIKQKRKKNYDEKFKNEIREIEMINEGD